MASWKKPLGAALAVEALGLAGFFAAALFRFSADKVVPAFAFRWERAEALLDFFRWLPALQFLGLSLALGSTSAGKADAAAQDEELTAGAIVPAVLLSVLFSAIVLLAGPSVAATRSAIMEASSSFNSSLEAARGALERGDLRLARAELAVCQAISGLDPRIEVVEERLANAELRAAKAEAPAAAQALPEKLDAKTARDYYLKALAFFEKGDFFSANWYAQTAARIDPSYLDAKRLAAKSWEELLSRGGKAEDRETADFYARKLEGYGLLRAGDPVAAYAIWKELSGKKASDPDVKRYLAESLAAAEKTAFFKDEYDRSAPRGAIAPVFLRIPAKGAPARILAAASASFSGDAVYFRELEYLEAGDPEAPKGGGAPRALVRAPYAKLAGGQLYLLCVDREARQAAYAPTWAAGPGPGPSSLIRLELAPEIAYRVLLARTRPASLDLFSAWKAVSEAPAYGADPAPLLRELAGRTGAPFALFASGLLGALVGARFRRRGGASKRASARGLYALLPFMAAAGIPAYLLTVRVDALLSAWAATALRGFSAIWVAAGVRAALIAVALIVVAGSKAERSRPEEP